jgi:6-pyruvoyltetrahydropterin/6-carboxytetrahydropterin synthase
MVRKQYITRKGNFDSAHRVMDEKMKCFNLHGHTYLYELRFSFQQSEEIGYAIDFKEIKRVFCQWIDDTLDHGTILNPQDTNLVLMCLHNDWKFWLMSLNDGEYCNPTVENIAKEIFLAVECLVTELYRTPSCLKLDKVTIYETPNCFTECYNTSVSFQERYNFNLYRKDELVAYAKEKGIIEYDGRKG